MRKFVAKFKVDHTWFEDIDWVVEALEALTSGTVVQSEVDTMEDSTSHWVEIEGEDIFAARAKSDQPVGLNVTKTMFKEVK